MNAVQVMYAWFYGLGIAGFVVFMLIAWAMSRGDQRRFEAQMRRRAEEDRERLERYVE